VNHANPACDRLGSRPVIISKTWRKLSRLFEGADEPFSGSYHSRAGQNCCKTK
jgi:hypothetical protein